MSKAAVPHSTVVDARTVDGPRQGALLGANRGDLVLYSDVDADLTTLVQSGCG